MLKRRACVPGPPLDRLDGNHMELVPVLADNALERSRLPQMRNQVRHALLRVSIAKPHECAGEPSESVQHNALAAGPQVERRGLSYAWARLGRPNNGRLRRRIAVSRYLTKHSRGERPWTCGCG
jgi:hypothetical protein